MTSKMGKYLATIIGGGYTGLSGLATHHYTSEYYNARDAVFRAALAKAQDLTPEAYQYAAEAVKMVPKEDLHYALVGALITGIGAGLTIHYATQPDE